MRELKKALRRELIVRRKALAPKEKTRADFDICAQLIPLIASAETVFTYVSTPIEVDTMAIIDYCLLNDIPVAVPRCDDEEMTFYYIFAKEELKIGRYGIQEPQDLTRKAVPTKNALCIVPALCADGNGFRLGYGKGYYDRFLKDFLGKSVILCYEDFKREVPTEPHDIKAHMTIFDRKNGG